MAVFQHDLTVYYHYYSWNFIKILRQFDLIIFEALWISWRTLLGTHRCRNRSFGVFLPIKSQLCPQSHGTPYIPHILSGASSSNKMGCCRKISLDFKHNPRTSCSDIDTDLPGLHPRTKNKTMINTDNVHFAHDEM